MVEFYLITLSASIPFNNHLTKIIKNMGNWDKFARIKGKGVSFKQKYRALKKNKNIFYE
jgi:hypothetical protein